MSGEDQVQFLKKFVQLCEANPAILHQPQFAFYREYLESLGAKLPPDTSSAAKDSGESKTKQKFEEQQPEEEEPTVEKEPELPEPELDNAGVIEDQTGELSLPMGDPNKEVGEEDLERASEIRDAAMAAFNQGDYKQALDNFTQAIELNPGSAILHAKRANTLLKMNKLKAAIQDCDKAISINSDSAQPYKFRGRAHRLMGNWLEAHRDLALSCKLDYDDTAYEWLKEVEPNAKKLQEYERNKQRLAEEKELKERHERIRRAQEANRKAAEAASAEENSDDGFAGGAGGGGGFGMGPFTELFKELSDDPELLAAMKNDPSLVQKIMEIMQNPANIMKHLGDPNVQKLIGKLGSKFGERAPGAPSSYSEAGGAEDASGHDDGAGETDETNKSTPSNGAAPPPKKAPEPDLD